MWRGVEWGSEDTRAACGQGPDFSVVAEHFQQFPHAIAPPPCLMDFFHRGGFQNFALQNALELATGKLSASLRSVCINPTAIPVMRRARLEKLQLPVAPLGLDTLCGHRPNGVLWLDSHSMEKHAIAAHAACGAESSGGFRKSGAVHKNSNPPCHASFSFPIGGAWIRPVSLSCLESAWPFSAFPARPQPTAPASSPQRLLEFFPSTSGEPSPGSLPESANPKLSRSSPSQYDAA